MFSLDGFCFFALQPKDKSFKDISEYIFFMQSPTTDLIYVQ